MENSKSVIRKEKSFEKRPLLPGEFAEVIDKHTLAFCFADGDIRYLNLEESVSKETAEEFIFRIKQFIENSQKNNGRI